MKVELVKHTVTQDAIGNKIKTKSFRRIYAGESSVSVTEYYAAGKNEMKPEKVFEIYGFEYEGETLLKQENVLYKVIRLYRRGDKLHLVCERSNCEH